MNMHEVKKLLQSHKINTDTQHRNLLIFITNNLPLDFSDIDVVLAQHCWPELFSPSYKVLFQTAEMFNNI